MERIERPINPVQRVNRALLQFCYALLGDRKLGSEPGVLTPDIAVGRKFASRLDIFGPLYLRGAAFSHGLSRPLGRHD